MYKKYKKYPKDKIINHNTKNLITWGWETMIFSIAHINIKDRKKENVKIIINLL